MIKATYKYICLNFKINIYIDQFLPKMLNENIFFVDNVNSVICLLYFITKIILLSSNYKILSIDIFTRTDYLIFQIVLVIINIGKSVHNSKYLKYTNHHPSLFK